MDRNREREHLAQADRHIAECNGHIARQREIVEKLALRGQPCEEAKQWLTTLQNSLSILERQRELILEALQEAK